MRSVPSDSVYAKTAKGIREVGENRVKLPRDLEIVFALVDGEKSAAELLPHSELTALKLYQALDLLVADGYIELASTTASSTPTPEDAAQIDTAPLQPDFDTAERVRELNVRVQAERRARERSERDARRALTDFGSPPYEGREIGAADSSDAAGRNAAHTESTAHPQHVPTALERAMSRVAESGAGHGLERGDRGGRAGHRGISDRVTATRTSGPLEPSAREQPESAPSDPPLGQRAGPHLAAGVSRHVAAGAAPAQKEHDTGRALRIRRPRRLKRPLAALAIALVAIPAAIVAWLQFTPLNHYVPAVQEALSERLQQPVMVGTVRYLLLPRPRLVLENVRVGRHQELRAERIETLLPPWSIRGGARRLELVEAYGVQMDARVLSLIPAWIGSYPPGALHTDHLRLHATKLSLPKTELGAFDGDVSFGADGRFNDALFANPHVRLELTRAAEGVRFILNAHEWRLPYGPPIEFSQLVADGIVNRAKSATAQFNGRAAGGAIAATVSARWPDAISMTGHFKIDQARIQDLAGGLTKTVGARGILSTTGRFNVQAADWAALPGQPRVNAQFSIARGELTNFDLLRALQDPKGGAVRGGRTPFEKLSGVVQVYEEHYRYRELQLVSGPLSAIGVIDVSGNGELSGRIRTELGPKGGVIARSVLLLTGTIQDPHLKR